MGRSHFIGDRLQDLKYIIELNMKAVIYARVSTPEQEESGYSLPAQEKMLLDYAQKRNLEVVKVFSIAESASGVKQRQVFREMIEYLEKMNISDMLIEKVDRLTRNFKEAVVANDWLEEDESRKIHFVKQNLVLHKNAKSDEKFRWDIEIVLAKKYVANLSEEVKKGQKEKLAQGWLPSKPPLGYKTIGEKGHKIHVLDENKASYIRQAFESYATGNYSLVALREMLYKDGLRTHSGAKLSKSRLADILGDPFYYGAIRWNDVVSENGRQEPLVSLEVWKKVQTVLQGKTSPHFKRHVFSFSKMLTCGECGGIISGEIQQGHIYYSCKHSKPCSQRGMTKEENIEKQLIGVFRLFENITQEEADEIYAKIRADHQLESRYKENTLTTLNQRYMALQRQLEILYDDRLAEKISPERWESKQATINQEQAEILRQTEKLKTEETKYYELYINILDLARRAGKIYAKRSPVERHLLLSHLFSNLTLRDKDVTCTLKKSVNTLSKRVQERLDAEKNLEVGKSKKTKGFSEKSTTTQFLLRR